MIRAVEQVSNKDKVWFGEFRPVLRGLTVSWPAWSFWVLGQEFQAPADSVALEPNAQYAQSIWLWLSPNAEDGYLHLDVVLEDGAYEQARPVEWPPIGCCLLLWGTLLAGASEPELQALRHVEVAA